MFLPLYSPPLTGFSHQNLARDDFNQGTCFPTSPSQLCSTSKAVCDTPRRRTSSRSSATASRREKIEAEDTLLISNNQAHDLQGIGAQFSSHSYAPVLHPQPTLLLHTLPSVCPNSHQIWNRMQPSTRTSTSLESYLNTQPNEQYALYYQPETKTLSTMRNCICLCS
jgi:hypothetical protein